jgi:UDP-N-acetylmuramoylalanine--D-glutamate ligase
MSLMVEQVLARGAEYRAQLKGRRMTVVGLGLSGVAACGLLRELGALVTATDEKPLDALPVEARELQRRGVIVYPGGHPPDAFESAEIVVLSPGVPLDHPSLRGVRASGVPVIGELELAWRVMEAEVIAITGTNGKTTTTALAGILLREQSRPVLVGGNIGRPLSAHALQFPANGLVVAEVSSFQLETIQTFHPRVAAVLNVTADHLDRHRTFEGYVDVKGRIFENQTEADIAVLNADDPMASALAGRTRARVVLFSRQRALSHGVFCQGRWIVARLNGHEEQICPLDEIFLRGQHNVENVLAAVACAIWTGAAPERLRAAIAGFRGVEHRIEWVRELQGVIFYNDSKGTNVASTIRAIESFTEPIVLIAGGRGKGQDFLPLAEAAKDRVSHAVLLGEDRERLARALSPHVPVSQAESMEEAVGKARAVARPGEVVLLSPACASFDMFDNFEHRGRVFKALVQALHA